MRHGGDGREPLRAGPPRRSRCRCRPCPLPVSATAQLGTRSSASVRRSVGRPQCSARRWPRHGRDIRCAAACASAPEVRSGTSLMNSVTRKASSASARGDQEDVRDAVAVRALHDGAQRRGQRVHVRDAAAGARTGRRGGVLGVEAGQAVLDVVGDPVGHHRAQRGDADRAAEGAEEGHRGAGRAEVLRAPPGSAWTAPGSASSCRCRDPAAP